MTKPKKHKWLFLPKFRRHAFGWRFQRAILQVKEAVKEIKATACKDPLVGAEGAILLMERLSPALEQVDSSSGAIETLVPIIAHAPAGDQVGGKFNNDLSEGGFVGKILGSEPGIAQG